MDDEEAFGEADDAAVEDDDADAADIVEERAKADPPLEMVAPSSDVHDFDVAESARASSCPEPYPTTICFKSFSLSTYGRSSLSGIAGKEDRLMVNSGGFFAFSASFAVAVEAVLAGVEGAEVLGDSATEENRRVIDAGMMDSVMFSGAKHGMVPNRLAAVNPLICSNVLFASMTRPLQQVRKKATPVALRSESYT